MEEKDRKLPSSSDIADVSKQLEIENVELREVLRWCVTTMKNFTCLGQDVWGMLRHGSDVVMKMKIEELLKDKGEHSGKD